MNGGAAERVDREGQSSGANGVHVDNVAQVFDIGEYEIFLPRRFRAERSLECRLLYAGIPIPQQLVGPTLDPLGRLSIGGPPFVGLYLNPPSSGGLSEGDDNGAGQGFAFQISDVYWAIVGVWCSLTAASMRGVIRDGRALGERPAGQ
jgi:hypothetical protein